MYRTANIHYTETVQKEAIIQSLTRQLYSLQERHQDYNFLQNQVSKINDKYQLIRAEKQRIQNENKAKLQINQQFILKLKTQGDNIRLEIGRQVAKIQPLRREMFLNQRVSEQKQSEIIALTRINLKTTQDNLRILQQNKTLSLNISQIQLQKQKQQKQKQRLSHSIQAKLTQQIVLQNESLQFEDSNKKLVTILSLAQKDNLELIQQSKIQEESLILLFKKLEKVNNEIFNLSQKNKMLTDQLTRGQQDLLSVSTDFQLLTIKNQQNENKISIYESHLKLLESDYEATVIQRGGLQKEQITYSLENKSLQNQVNQILLSIAHAEKQHQYLVQQSGRYIAENEQTSKKLLGRKEITGNIIHQVNTGISETSYYIAHLR